MFSRAGCRYPLRPGVSSDNPGTMIIRIATEGKIEFQSSLSLAGVFRHHICHLRSNPSFPSHLVIFDFPWRLTTIIDTEEGQIFFNSSSGKVAGRFCGRFSRICDTGNGWRGNLRNHTGRDTGTRCHASVVRVGWDHDKGASPRSQE